MRRQVHHLRAGVLELAFTSKRHRQHLAAGVLTGHPHGRVLHGDLGANVAVDPLHGRAFLGACTLGYQVVHVVRPVLNGGVTAAPALFHNDLHHCRVQGVRLVDRGRATLDVVHVRIFIHNDQGALKLAHVLRVNTEVRLQRNVYMHPWRHINKGATGPNGGVQGRELVVTSGNNGAKVLLEQLFVLTKRGVGIDENDALFLQILTDLVVDHLRLILRGNTCNQALLLRLRNAQLVVGVLNILRQVFPAGRLLLRRADVVLDVVKVNARQVSAPSRHRLLFKDLECLQTLVEHPLRLFLNAGDVTHNLCIQAATRGGASDVRVMPAVVVSTDGLNDLIIIHRRFKAGCGSRFRHRFRSLAFIVCVVVPSVQRDVCGAKPVAVRNQS